MSAGILQLVARGIDDLFIIGDPQITFFKIVYRRYSNFSKVEHKLTFSKSLDFGRESVCKLKRHGDLLHKLYLIIDLPDIQTLLKIATKADIKKLLNQYQIIWPTTTGVDLTQNLTQSDIDDITILITNKMATLINSINVYEQILNTLQLNFDPTINTSINTQTIDTQSYLNMMIDATVQFDPIITVQYEYINDLISSTPINSTENVQTYNYEQIELNYYQALRVYYNNTGTTETTLIKPINGLTIESLSTALANTIAPSTILPGAVVYIRYMDQNFIFISNVEFSTYNLSVSSNSYNLFHSVIADVYSSDTANLYTTFDAYLIFNRFLLANNFTLQNTNDVATYQTQLVTTIETNMQLNFKLLTNVFTSLNATGGSTSAGQHLTFTIFKIFPSTSSSSSSSTTTNTTSYDKTGNFTNLSLVNSSLFGNADNFSSYYSLSSQSATFYYGTDSQTYLKQFHVANLNYFLQTIFQDYFNNDLQTLWTRLNIPSIYPGVLSYVNGSQLTNMYLMDYIPIMAINDIGQAIISYLQLFYTASSPIYNLVSGLSIAPSNSTIANFGTYNVGTVSTTGGSTSSLTVVTGSGTQFTNLMVGGSIIFATGYVATIAIYGSQTSLTTSTEIPTVQFGTTYQIYYNGFLTSSVGTVGTNSTTSQTIVGIGTAFVTAMIGGTLVFTTGAISVITAVGSSTQLTVQSSINIVNGTTYTIYYSGSSYSVGTVGANNINNPTTIVMTGVGSTFTNTMVGGAIVFSTSYSILAVQSGVSLTLNQAVQLQNNTAYNIVSTYNVGTAGTSVVSVTVTGIGTAFNNLMVGGTIQFISPSVTATIASIISGTALTVTLPINVPFGSNYVITYQYNVGTVGTNNVLSSTITGLGTSFASSMIGSAITLYITASITEYISPTQLSIMPNTSIATNTSYTIYYGGLPQIQKQLMATITSTSTQNPNPGGSTFLAGGDLLNPTLADISTLINLSQTYTTNTTDLLTVALLRPEIRINANSPTLEPTTNTTANGVNTINNYTIMDYIKKLFTDYMNNVLSTFALHTSSSATRITNDIMGNTQSSILGIIPSFFTQTTSLASYSTYKNTNNYRVYPINFTTVTYPPATPQNTPIFDAVSSIWYTVQNGFISSFNNFFNNNVLNPTYYNQTLGAEMYNYLSIIGLNSDSIIPSQYKEFPLLTGLTQVIDYYLLASNTIFYNDTTIGVAPVSAGSILFCTNDVLTQYNWYFSNYTNAKYLLQVKNIQLNRELFYYDDNNDIMSELVGVLLGTTGSTYYFNLSVDSESQLYTSELATIFSGNYESILQTTVINSDGTKIINSYNNLVRNSFLTVPNDPYLSAIPYGYWQFNLWAYVDSVLDPNANTNINTSLYANIYIESSTDIANLNIKIVSVDSPTQISVPFQVNIPDGSSYIITYNGTTYGYGTIGTAGILNTALTGLGTTFTSAMTGAHLEIFQTPLASSASVVLSDIPTQYNFKIEIGLNAIITAYTSPTSITINKPFTIPSNTQFRIDYNSLNPYTTGTVGVNNLLVTGDVNTVFTNDMVGGKITFFTPLPINTTDRIIIRFFTNTTSLYVRTVYIFHEGYLRRSSVLTPIKGAFINNTIYGFSSGFIYLDPTTWTTSDQNLVKLVNGAASLVTNLGVMNVINGLIGNPTDLTSGSFSQSTLVTALPIAEQQTVIQNFKNWIKNLTVLYLYNDIANISQNYNNFASTLDIYNYILNYILSQSTIASNLNTLGVYPSQPSTPTTNSNAIIQTYNNVYNYYFNIDSNLKNLLRSMDDTPTTSVVPVVLLPQPKLLTQIETLVNGTKGSFAWIKYLGHYIIDYVSVEFDGQTIESQTGEWLQIWHKLSQLAEHERGYNLMIGNVDELQSFSTADKKGYKLYIPLQFWFCRNVGSSIPLVALKHTLTTLRVKLKNFSDVAFFDQFTIFKTTPKVECSIYADYFYVENDQRKRLAEVKHEHLIDTVSYGGTVVYGYNNLFDQINGIVRPRLHFSEPTKELIWVIQRLDKIDGSLLNGEKRYYDYTYDTNQLINLSTQASVIFNGRERQQLLPSSYYNWVQPFQHHTSSPDLGMNVWSMAISPELIQPTGSANFSRIDEVSLVIYLTQKLINDMQLNNTKIRIGIYSVSYNILRIMSGLAGLASVTT